MGTRSSDRVRAGSWACPYGPGKSFGSENAESRRSFSASSTILVERCARTLRSCLILCYPGLVSFSCGKESAMKCPRCHADLVAEQEYHGIEVDRCPSCDGRWLDHDELDQLEATVPSTPEERRATIRYAERRSELHCVAKK
jgi:Zn-finger nucleic acid-binding protein